jgi:hypothetical protein
MDLFKTHQIGGYDLHALSFAGPRPLLNDRIQLGMTAKPEDNQRFSTTDIYRANRDVPPGVLTREGEQIRRAIYQNDRSKFEQAYQQQMAVYQQQVAQAQAAAASQSCNNPVPGRVVSMNLSPVPKLGEWADTEMVCEDGRKFIQHSVVNPGAPGADGAGFVRTPKRLESTSIPLPTPPHVPSMDEDRNVPSPDRMAKDGDKWSMQCSDGHSVTFNYGPGTAGVALNPCDDYDNAGFKPH